MTASGAPQPGLCDCRLLPAQQRHGRIHAATRSFQALRIAVNDELGVLETLLNDAPTGLSPAAGSL